jgi:hypothetical protein
MARKLTQADIVERIKEVHGDKYDLSKVNYINRRTKVTLICSIHGEFNTTTEQLFRGQGCYKCGKKQSSDKRRTFFEDFVKNAKAIHGEKYKYYPETYIKSSALTKINCKEHGDFEQKPSDHLNQKQGCPVCGRISQTEKRKFSNEEYIQKANTIHRKKYSYPNLKYKNSNSKINISCPKHGIFNTNPGNHLQGSGCPKCGIENVHKLQLKSIDDFILESNLMHNNKFNYSQVNYKGGKIKVKIICPKHGLFEQSPNHHQRGAGCPNCNISKGEELIKKILKKHNVEFKTQFTFDELKDKRKLKCDFYLPQSNSIIEFNGRQHYEPVTPWGGIQNLNEIKRRDQLKRDFCKKYSINLLEIHFQEKQVERIIKTFLKL